MANQKGARRLRLYIDESGDHRPAREEEGFARRYLCVVGVTFPIDGPVQPTLEALKRKHFPEHDAEDAPICLHRREIIDASPPFAALRDASKREAFNEDLLQFLGDQHFFVIGVVIDKFRIRSVEPVLEGCVS